MRNTRKAGQNSKKMRSEEAGKSRQAEKRRSRETGNQKSKRNSPKKNVSFHSSMVFIDFTKKIGFSCIFQRCSLIAASFCMVVIYSQCCIFINDFHFTCSTVSFDSCTQLSLGSFWDSKEVAEQKSQARRTKKNKKPTNKPRYNIKILRNAAENQVLKAQNWP